MNRHSLHNPASGPDSVRCSGTGTDHGTCPPPSARPDPHQTWTGRLAFLATSAVVLILALAVSVTLIDYSTGDGTGTTPGTGQAQPVSPSAPAIDRTRVDNLLNAHAAALLAGDEQGWLDVADPARPGVVAWYRQLYTTLKALRVTWFDYRVPEEIAGGRPGPRPENVSVEYCLAGVTCDRNSSHATAPMQLQFTERGGRWWVTDVADRADGWKTALNPPPWLADTLHVRCQGAVIVAASPALAGRVDSIAAAADRAAAVTNRYIRPTGTPPTYLIYLAGPAQCETWHDRPAPPATPLPESPSPRPASRSPSSSTWN